eukprot:678022-Ditylum_brightwellii.AAC.1
MEFVDKVRGAKTKAWQEFTSTLNYDKSAAESINIVKAINREEHELPPNTTIESKIEKGTKEVLSDKEKAEAFR